MIHKGYRPEVPYHNWEHATSVTHFAYILARFHSLNQYLPQLHVDMVVFSSLSRFCIISTPFINTLSSIFNEIATYCNTVTRH